MIEEILKMLNYPLVRFGSLEVTLSTIINFIIVLLLAYFIARYIRHLLINRLLSHIKIEQGIKYVIAYVMGYAVFVLGLLIGLQTLGIDLTSFTVLAGAFGLGVGFGLQNIINNFVSGLIILSERLIQIGDRIQVGSFDGNLLKIGARSSILKTSENLTVIVPNSEFITQNVINWGKGTLHPVRFDVEVGVSYDSDLHLVEKILMDVASRNAHILKDPAPAVELFEFGNSAINFRLFVWTMDKVSQSGALKSQLYFAIWDQFREHRIEIPFPIQSIRLPTPVQVELKK